jgi:hypothetical protein
MPSLTAFEREECLRIISKFLTTPFGHVFQKLDLSTGESWITAYREMIPTPMDLVTVQSKVQNNKYQNRDEFYRDMDMMFANCEKFNGSDSPLGLEAREGRLFVKKQMKKMCASAEEKWLAKVRKVAGKLNECSIRLSKAVLRECAKTRR